MRIMPRQNKYDDDDKRYGSIMNEHSFNGKNVSRKMYDLPQRAGDSYVIEAAFK